MSVPTSQAATTTAAPPTAAERRHARRVAAARHRRLAAARRELRREEAAAAKRRRARRARYLASLTKDFSGDGGLTLPPFSLPKDSTLTWTNAGSFFAIYDSVDTSDGGVPVNSQGHSGKTYLSAGKHKFEVNALGHWTIHIEPAG